MINSFVDDSIGEVVTPVAVNVVKNESVKGTLDSEACLVVSVLDVPSWLERFDDSKLEVVISLIDGEMCEELKLVDRYKVEKESFVFSNLDVNCWDGEYVWFWYGIVDDLCSSFLVACVMDVASIETLTVVSGSNVGIGEE